jgi:hypothetical protein
MYPTIELKYSLLRTGLWIVFLMFWLVITGFDGHPVETGPHSVTPTGNAIAFLVIGGCLILALYQLIKRMRINPALVISKQGLVLPRFSSQFIPWTAVKEITFRSVGKRNSQVMDLLLGDDLPAELREAVERRRYQNYRKDGTVVTLIPWDFSGMSEAGIIEAIQRYHRAFGTAHPAADA